MIPVAASAAEAALADDGDPWAVFAGFMGRIVEADTHSFTLRLAGRGGHECCRRCAVVG